MQRNFFKELLFLSFFTGFSVSLFGQSGQTDQNWWFGNTSRGIQFSQPKDSAVLVSRPGTGFASYGTNGGAVASDPVTGGLLFYTDGVRVYDATHTPMPGSINLNGDPSRNQPAAICSVPDQPNRYYVFTNSSTGQIFVSQVDMTATGNSPFPAPPLGDIVAGPTPVANLTTESQAMILIPHSNGNDYWLITQELGTSSFNITLITTAPVTGPASPFSPAGAVIPSFTAAHFAYDTATNTLGVAPSDVNKNVLLYDFDPRTGTLTADANTIVFGTAAAAGSPAIYDIEFSPSGQYLYVSKTGTAGNGLLLQIDLTDRTASPDTIAANLDASLGLQIGADSAIYHLYQDGATFLVARINDPDTIAADALYEADVFNHNFNARQFPVFGQIKSNVNVDFTFLGSCSNTPTSFFPTVTPGADSLVWDFGDQTGSSAWSPTHTYEAGNTYDVKVKAFVNGEAVDSAIQSVPITQFDVQISLVQDTTACSCELARPKAPNPDPTYPDGTACNPFRLTAQINPQGTGSIQWFGPEGLLPGQTNAEVTIDTAGFYYVVVTEGACSTYAGVNVKEYGVQDQRANVWHFGNGAGLDFNPPTGVEPITFPMTSAEGVATISDENGQAILSTNGDEVFDSDGNVVATGLGGSENATQSSLIIPFPGDPTLFYIFTTQEVLPAPQQYELRYAVFDRKILPNGDIVQHPLGISTVLFTKSTERITGNENWLIAHEFGTNNFLAYPLTAEGIGTPVVSSAGSVHSLANLEEAQGYMELGPGYLAVAFDNKVEIFDFDNATGEITLHQPEHAFPAGEQAYGIEFSGNRLFVTTMGSPGGLHEFIYDSATLDFVYNAPPLATGNFGAIQSGPDGNIYVAVNTANALGIINPASDITTPSSFDAGGQPLAGGTSSTLGLPNFMQNLSTAPMQPSITVQNPCVGDTVFFAGTGTDVIDTLVWNFGDTTMIEETVGSHEIKHLYQYPGTYKVVVQIRNRCKGLVSTVEETVTIHPRPTAISDGMVLCTGTEVMTASNPPLTGLSFLWSTRDTTNTVIPPGQGIYTVTVTSDQGCTDEGEWFVADNRPQLDLGPDRTVCQNSGDIELDADPTTTNNNSVTSYSWTGAVTSTNQTVTETTENAGTFTYMVEVNNSFTGCQKSDTIAITVNAEPGLANVDAQDPTACGAADGKIVFDITTTGLYSWSITGPSPAQQASDVSGPVTDINSAAPGSLAAGSYDLVVQDQVSGCSNQETVPISDANFTATLARDQACNVGNVMPTVVSVAGATPPATFTYTILDASNQQPVVGGDQTNADPTSGIPNGTYVVEVRSAGCLAVSPQTLIEQEDPVQINGIEVDQCQDPITLEVDAPSAAGYFWTGPDIIGPINTPTVTASPASGQTHTYTVIAQGDGSTSCDNSSTATVTPGTDPTPSITESDPCEESVILSAQPAGNYAYVWEDAEGNRLPGGQELFVTADDNGQVYTVRILNTSTGCELPPASVTVGVLGEVLVDIVARPACEGVPFNLVATTPQPISQVSFQWDFNTEPIEGATSQTLTVNDGKSGDYGVTVIKNAFGKQCVAADKVGIKVSPQTPGSLPDQGIICPYDENLDPRTRSVTLDAGDDFISYLWYTVTGTNESPAPDDNDGNAQTYVATASGSYRVKLINFYNCPSEDNITLIEECDPQITGPNAFRPDGLNKEFGLFTFFIADESFQIYIFNRWGEMVYQSNARDFKWNGGYKNDASQPVPPGTYSYVVKYKSVFRPELGVQEYRSGVVVLR